MTRHYEPTLLVKDAVRQRVYEMLLSEPERAWTVADMAGCLRDVSVNGLRTTFFMLLSDRLMDIDESVARQHVLTLRLTEEGRQILAETLSGWGEGAS